MGRDAALGGAERLLSDVELGHAEAVGGRLHEGLRVPVRLVPALELSRGELGGQVHRGGVPVAEGEAAAQLRGGG